MKAIDNKIVAPTGFTFWVRHEVARERIQSDHHGEIDVESYRRFIDIDGESFELVGDKAEEIKFRCTKTGHTYDDIVREDGGPGFHAEPMMPRGPELGFKDLGEKR